MQILEPLRRLVGQILELLGGPGSVFTVFTRLLSDHRILELFLSSNIKILELFASAGQIVEFGGPVCTQGYTTVLRGTVAGLNHLE